MGWGVQGRLDGGCRRGGRSAARPPPLLRIETDAIPTQAEFEPEPNPGIRTRPPPPQYATWEESQKDFRRARSVWERALDNDYRNTTVWLKVGGGVWV
jgi:hypothetical protein